MALAQLALLAHLPSIIPLVVFLGASNGMDTLARATIVAEIFGPLNYGSISGAMSVGSTMARAAGPVTSSLLLGVLGGYPGVVWLLAGMLVVAGGGGMLTSADVTVEGGEAASDRPS